MKNENYEQQVNSILNEIRNGNTLLSNAEVSQLVGCSIEDAKNVLNIIFTRYYTEVDFNQDSGIVYYKFDKKLKRRKKIAFGEIFLNFILAFKNIIIGFLKSIVAIVMLAIYFVYQVLPLLLGIFSKDKQAKYQSQSFLNMYFATLQSVFYGIVNYSSSRKIVFKMNKKGQKYRQLYYENPKTNQDNIGSTLNAGKSISDMVFDFVFGPRRAVYNKKETKQRVINTIIQNKGILRVIDLIELDGISYQEAENKLLEYCEEFQSEINFNQDGSLYCYFPEFEDKEADIKTSKIVKYHEEIEPPYFLIGNSVGENFMIGLLMLVPTVLTISYFFNKSMNRGHYKEFFQFLVGFTTFVFAFPLIRLPIVWLMNLTLNQKNIRRKLLKRIFSKRHLIIIPEKILLSKSDPKAYRKMLGKIALELKAQVEFDEKGDIQYNFEILFNPNNM